MLKKLLLLFFLSTSVFAASLEDFSKKIHAYLLLEETQAAIVEARKLCDACPDLPLGYEFLIKSLAQAGEEDEMLRVWETFSEDFPKEAKKRDLLEDMCWGILLKARKAGGITTQLIALLGAALTQQVKAVSVLKAGMQDSNSHIRAIAVPLSAIYADQTLKEHIIHLFRKERVWDVKKEVLKAIGTLKMTSLLPELMQKLNDGRLGAEEKKEVLSTITTLREKIERKELEFLLKNRKAALRMLAAQTMAELELHEEMDLLQGLLCDSHPDVKVSALQAWGILRGPAVNEIELAAESRLPEVSITAGWCLLLAAEEKGNAVLRRWLESENEEGRLLAAAALGSAGKYGIYLAKEQLEKCVDPYVRINLAIALLRQRVHCDLACKEVDLFLKEHQEKVMWKEDFFTFLKESTVEHSPIIPNCPEVINQTVRLEILNLLAIMEYPGALEAIKRFLKESRWGVTGIASEMLLGEGDETALDLVRDLLTDPDREVRTEAALVLASWGHDAAALPVLLKIYHEGDRSLKLKILESLGRIGEPSTIPFLLERLKEPSQILRTVAACILIQTLNH